MKGNKSALFFALLVIGTIKLKNVNGTSDKNILISTFGKGKATISGGNSEAIIVEAEAGF